MKDKGRTFQVYLPAGAVGKVRKMANNLGYRSPAHFLQAIVLKQLSNHDRDPFCRIAMDPEDTKGFDRKGEDWDFSVTWEWKA